MLNVSISILANAVNLTAQAMNYHLKKPNPRLSDVRRMALLLGVEPQALTQNTPDGLIAEHINRSNFSSWMGWCGEHIEKTGWGLVALEPFSIPTVSECWEEFQAWEKLSQ
jgi:hypothetical protein